MKRLLCVILALLMLAPFVLPAQAAGGSGDPSVAVWVNGNWVAAKSLAGLSGDMWVEFPISTSVLKDSGEGSGATNYVRITSNVANGSTKDTQINMMGSACGWSNTYISHNWWVDSDWASLGTVNADLAIEGWNGTQWLRIHNDHDCVADTSLTLGNVGGSDYQGYARNIWTDNNTLKNYTNFRIRVHLDIGTSLTVASGDILNLFPAENYHDCTFCETCGGCQSAACTLGHVLCTCGGDPPVLPDDNPSLAIYVNGNWISAVSVKELTGDQWIEFPINADALKDSGETNGATNYVRITSNVANGASAESQVNLLFSNCGWSNTYVSHNWWVDDDWAAVDNCNADIAIEGWNGTQWVRIHNDHDCTGDVQMQLGLTGAGKYSGFARNIWVDNNTLKNYTNFRIRAHCVVGTSLAENKGDISALFPEENYRDCTFCELCGGCLSNHCTLGHVLCTCGGGNPSVTISVNGTWITAVSVKELTGDQWIEFPINADALKDSGETNGATNYVRIASNVANGASADSQINLLFSNCGWSNTFASHNWWVDDDWTAVENSNADIAIEGWNGSQWVRIHNDHECAGDFQMPLGLTGSGTYSGFARNIWVENDTLKNYTNFRIRAHCVVGTSLKENKGDISAIFPEENYRDCVFCETCGGCLSENCTLGHVLCTCGGDPPVLPGDNPSLAIYVNGNWISAVSVKELTGDQWIEFPINADALKDTGETNGATNYVRITSNVKNGHSDESRINLLFSNCGWSNTFVSGNWWVDDDWSAIESSNADIAIEGWNGTQWIRIHNDHECTGDYQMQIGLTDAGTYAGFARNIWVENDSLKNYTNFRIRAHCVVGTSLAENKGEISAIFPEENYRDCVFCETCGGCLSENCTLGHVLCTCGLVCEHKHTVLTGVVEPTCTQPGYTGDYVCEDCGETVTYGTTIDPLGHDYHLTGWTWNGVESASACFTCSRDASHVETVEADISSVRTEPTSEENGSVVYTASVTFMDVKYTDTKTEILPALGHNYVLSGWNWDGYETATATFVDTNGGAPLVLDATITSVRTEPTCEEAGKIVYTASVIVSGKSYEDQKTETLAALGHDIEIDAAVAPTCTETGLTEGSHCRRCDYQVAQQIVPALGHDLIDHAAQAATCTEKGWNAYQTCSRCDYTTYVEINALGHDLVRDDPVAPTCTEPGLTAGEHCSRCDFKVAQETVPALGHDLVRDDPVAATCTETGLTAGEHCSRCDYKVAQEETPALGHDWNDGEVTTPATATKDGVKTFTCKRCGATRTETIPATGENKPCDGGKDCPSYKFKDVKAGDWYHEAVDFAVTMGLFNGMTETTFEPNTPMTRAMLVTVLWRYEGSPEEGKNTFTDVPDGQWYAKAVAWAAENAIVGGVGNNKFDPNGNITREQLATILFRYAGNKGYDISAFGDFTGFPDKNKISSWAADAYSWAVGEKLITGNNINGVIYLDPQGNATRAQVATILMRFLTKET